jgi:hypothetical protein
MPVYLLYICTISEKCIDLKQKPSDIHLSVPLRWAGITVFFKLGTLWKLNIILKLHHMDHDNAPPVGCPQVIVNTEFCIFFYTFVTSVFHAVLPKIPRNSVYFTKTFCIPPEVTNPLPWTP